MNLTIDIEDISKPVVNEAGLASFFVPKISFVARFLSNMLLNHLNKKINNLILSLEGALIRLDSLDKMESEQLLKETKNIISDFGDLKEKISSRNYYNNSQLEFNFKYIMKVLYKIESRLHKTVYKDAPVIKTPDELKKGVIKMNSMYLNNLLKNS